MRSPSLRGRLPAGSGLLLIPAASLVVHQLRYTLAYGSRANAELAAQGHSYLSSLTPWFVFALGIGLALFLRRAAHALRTGDAGVFAPAVVGDGLAARLGGAARDLRDAGVARGAPRVRAPGRRSPVSSGTAATGRSRSRLRSPSSSRSVLRVARAVLRVAARGTVRVSAVRPAPASRSPAGHARRSGSARPRLRGPCASARAAGSVVEPRADGPRAEEVSSEQAIGRAVAGVRHARGSRECVGAPEIGDGRARLPARARPRDPSASGRRGADPRRRPIAAHRPSGRAG